jgi:ribose transport system ATP-binding protein
VSAAPALSVVGATKAFHGVRALNGVDLEVRHGEIHALLGENGTGKSTLIKLLAGVYAPDAGNFSVGGKELQRGFTPSDVARAGIRFVHQDYGLIDTLSVAENIALVAGYPKRRGLIDHTANERAARAQLAALDLNVNPVARVGSLPQAERAIVALSRAMQRGARVIVLDEVTAALPSPDAARVHKAIRAAKAAGVAFIYVSHRLEEVFDLCDRMTVLRDGLNVATVRVADARSEQVIEWIAGKTLSMERRAAVVEVDAPIRIRGEKLIGGVIETPVDLSVRAGEILGVTGILGSGYSQICEWLCGLERPATGSVAIDGAAIAFGTTRRARDCGCEIVVGDRTRGAFAERKVRENIFADAIGRRNGRVDLREEARDAARTLDTFKVRPRGASEMQMQALSGGNQQKVLFARALAQRPKALVLIDPTAGVDIGARAELHDLLRQSAAAGAAIVLGASDFEEVAAISSRVLVARDGAIGAELVGDEIRWDRLFAEAHGGKGAHGHVQNDSAANGEEALS